MTPNVALDYIISAIDVALVLFFVAKLLRKYNGNWKRTLIIIVVQACINILMEDAFGKGNPLGLLVMIITAGMLFKLIFREGIFTINILIVLALISMFIAEGIAVLILCMFGIMPMDIDTQTLPMILGAGISKTIYFVFVWRFISRMKLDRSINKNVLYQILLVSVFNLIIISMAFWLYANVDSDASHSHSIYYIVLTTIGAIVFSLGILSITKGIISGSQREAEWQKRETEYKRLMFYIDNTSDMLKSINSQRHDFSNHINCLYGLLKLNKTKEAREYIERLVDEINEFNVVVDAGNPVLTALLNTKLMVAQRDKIYMEADIDLPEEMGVEPIDLSIIVGNLLDNALEACRRKDVLNKYIEVDMDIDNDNLVIRVCNSKSDAVNAGLAIASGSYTSKEDASNHGFGLNNIRQAVEKYHGTVQFEDHGECFIANIAIPISV